MTPHARAELVYASDLRMGRLARPWQAPIAPAEQRRRWSTVLVSLLATLCIAAVAVAGRNN